MIKSIRLQREWACRAKRKASSFSSTTTCPTARRKSYSESNDRWTPTSFSSSRFLSTLSQHHCMGKRNNHTPNRHDRLLVVGSGVAGCATALVAAETYRVPVTLLFAGNIAHDCNSFWAQGGIIYRNYNPASGDSADSLASDIHRAGAGLCEDDAVQKVSQEGPDRVRELLLNPNGPFANVPFDKTPGGELSLCLGMFMLLCKECL